jgi:hypothetical protein
MILLILFFILAGGAILILHICHVLDLAIATMSALTINFALVLYLGWLGWVLVARVMTDIHMNQEIPVICIIWTLATAVFHASLNYEDWKKWLSSSSSNVNVATQEILMWCGCGSLLVRNFVGFAVSILHPIVRSRPTAIVPYGETRECVANVEITLATELPFHEFANFIEAEYKAPGTNILTLYSRIKLFENAVEKERDLAEQTALAVGICDDFLQEDGESFVEFLTDEQRRQVLVKKNSIPSTLNKDFFNPIYAPVLKRLDDYFKDFRNSDVHKQLYLMLILNEIVYERFFNANLT